MSSLAGDPAVHAALRLALAALFASAAAHKARDLPGFAATVSNYRLAPTLGPAFSTSVAASLLGIETMIAVGLLWQPAPAALAAVVLLTVYSGAIAINLARGRRDIDCGCLGPRHRQAISEWLLLRNGGAIAAAAALLAPTTTRPLQLLDWLTIAASVAGAATIWMSANQLLETWPRLRLLAHRASQ